MNTVTKQRNVAPHEFPFLFLFCSLLLYIIEYILTSWLSGWSTESTRLEWILDLNIQYTAQKILKAYSICMLALYYIWIVVPDWEKCGVFHMAISWYTFAWW